MIPQELILLANVSGDLTGNAAQWQGGLAAFEVAGNLGGATVTLHLSRYMRCRARLSAAYSSVESVE